MATEQLASAPASVDLYWLPLGAGDNTHCVRTNGRIFEWATARYQHRERCDLYHAALEARVGADRFVIEMTPVWGTDAPDRGVVCEGPVGLRWLGGSRFFRYEVRCWRDGVIPDVAEAVDSPRRISTDPAQAERIRSLAPEHASCRSPRMNRGQRDLTSGPADVRMPPARRSG